MCGICGFISQKKIEEAVLMKMNDVMFHRGPDDAGIYQSKVGKLYLGMGHRRLSILDLSSKGHQPMVSASGDSIITYNGEIYNYSEIRKELIDKGYRFKTNCDTEVVIEAYEEYGEKCVEKFNGMFAFAIYDKKERKLFLARDRFGKKPLYVFCNKLSKEFVFASSLKSIMLFPTFDKKINEQSLYRFLYYGYINEPDSIFLNVSKLSSGEMMCLKLDDFDCKTKKYWNVYDSYMENAKQKITEYCDCKEELKRLLFDSVKKRLISDVPIGTFLSGGIDSTLVTAFANEASQKTVNTYSIGFNEVAYDESRFSKKISEHLGTNHHSLIVTEKDMFDLVDDLPLFFDEPFGDSSQLPTMLVSKFAKNDITVALSGDGGDELFCGYKVYDEILRMQRYKKIIKLMGPIIDNKIVYEMAPSRVKSVIDFKNHSHCQWASSALKKIVDGMLKKASGSIMYEEDKSAFAYDIQERRMLLDMSTYLPNDILHKVDRASMKYSLETRCPLLDYNIAELSFRIPHNYKYMNGEKKYILKDIVYDYVPKELLDRPKTGFSIPLHKMLQLDNVKQELFDYSSYKCISEQNLFDFDFVQKIMEIVFGNKSDFDQSYIKNAVNVLWNYYMFQKWYYMCF